MHMTLIGTLYPIIISPLTVDSSPSRNSSLQLLYHLHSHPLHSYLKAFVTVNTFELSATVLTLSGIPSRVVPLIHDMLI